MPETDACSYLARERFSREEEANRRRRQAAGSSRKVTDWCAHNLHRIVPEGKILDLACGNGRHFSELRTPRVQLIAGDLSVPMLRQAKRAGGDESLVCFEAEGLPFEDRSFDGIFSARFFHHLPTPEIRARILSEMFRVARLAVAITFKAEYSGEHLRHLIKCAIRKNKPRRYFCSVGEFQRVAEMQGWKVSGVFAPGHFLSSNRGILFEPR